MKAKYLKCRYQKGMFRDEYCITFKGKNQNWCVVSRADVIPKNSKEGYVKCYPYAKVGKDICVWINDVGDHGVSPFRVAEGELVSLSKAA